MSIFHKSHSTGGKAGGTLSIISRSNEPFYDRTEAGRQLGEELKKYHGHDVVVLGIPRGGVVIADGIAGTLDARLDVIFTHKLGAPGNPELAIGSIGENGKVFLNAGFVKPLNIPADYIADEKGRQLARIRERYSLFRKACPKIPLHQKIVIITDDGVATGATVRAALWNIRQEKPKKIIAAFPVGPKETLEKLAEEADQAVCLRLPLIFGALSQFYVHFDQVDDAEVLEILKQRRGHSNSRDTYEIH